MQVRVSDDGLDWEDVSSMHSASSSVHLQEEADSYVFVQECHDSELKQDAKSSSSTTPQEVSICPQAELCLVCDHLHKHMVNSVHELTGQMMTCS